METAHIYTTPDGVAIHYRLSKSEHPRGTVVLLHGMASNLTRWSEFLEHTRLKADWDIVRLDLRGHGGSFARGKIGFPVWTADLIGLLDTIGANNAVLVGHSLGAHLALYVAGRHPDRVRGLVLIDPVFPPALRGRMRLFRYLRPAILAVIAVIRFLNRLRIHRGRLPQRDLRQLDEQVRRELLAAGNSEEFVRRYSSPLTDMKYLPVGHYLQEMADILGPVPVPAQISAPTLVLLSQALTYTDTATTMRLIEESPSAEHETIDAYHWPLTERPAQVREAIERWIARRFERAEKN